MLLLSAVIGWLFVIGYLGVMVKAEGWGSLAGPGRVFGFFVLAALVVAGLASLT